MSAQQSKNDPLGISVLLSNRELLMQMIRRQLTQDHKGTLFGKAWLIFKPLSLLALYVFVFGYVFEGKFRDTGDEAPATYALGVFLGLTIIHFTGDILAISPICISAHKNMVTRVKMPLEVIPAAVTASAIVHFWISMGLALIGLFAFGHPPNLQILWLIPIFLFLSIAGLGLSYLFATIGVYMRDINQITPVLNMGLLFASAVFYPVEKIPPLAWSILKFNPVLLAVEGTRQTALWQNSITLGPAAYYFAGCCLLLYVLGYTCFQKTKRKFADLI